jgi:quinol-cytochrome oxidoreductase complex cytochrome b subunit
MMSLRINAVVAAIAHMFRQLFAALYLAPGRLLHVLLLLLLVALGCLPVMLLLPMLVGSLT